MTERQLFYPINCQVRVVHLRYYTLQITYNVSQKLLDTHLLNMYTNFCESQCENMRLKVDVFKDVRHLYLDISSLKGTMKPTGPHKRGFFPSYKVLRNGGSRMSFM